MRPASPPVRGPHLLNLFPMQFHGDYADFFLVIEPGAEMTPTAPAVMTGQGAGGREDDLWASVTAPDRKAGLQSLETLGTLLLLSVWL